ncbi:uncharacterized protein LOC126907293 [Daktulosphaira vitifoliae]|uniref:uncharacterized protein LOC126907293 n=1 Tax=Daktulosphaira vitifoliae TaxID=58002 RepID=UPI0021AA3751|nr:uncharacterized protein LOC126907293 [Daktulosphaira vitifoliae]
MCFKKYISFCLIYHFSTICATKLEMNIMRSTVPPKISKDKTMFDLENIEELSEYNNQAGGHIFSKKKPFLGFLKFKGKYVLKSPGIDAKGMNEINFYEDIHKSDLSCFKKLIPNYYGLINLKINNIDTTFLVLDDITKDMIKPCVMDVKIGKQTWQPGCKDYKKEIEQNKCKKCKETYGICIQGIHYYVVKNNVVSETPEKAHKDLGKSLEPNEVNGVLGKFLNIDTVKSSNVINSLLEQLSSIIKYFNVQKHHHFFSSSIILSYDADTLTNDKSPIVKVSMVDFAHTIPAGEVIDENYLFGVKNLYALLEELNTKKAV